KQMNTNTIHTDLCIIGAGPVGPFAVVEAGLLKMRCHLIDALGQVGGPPSEIDPRKPIYDIPGYPEVNAQDVVDNLMEQAKPFQPTFTLGERVDHLDKQADGSFIVTTSDKTRVHAQVIIIAGGLGCFEPRKPVLTNLEQYEGKGINYMVKNPETFRDKNVVIAGGGDSALDWTIFLAKVAKRVTLVHRNETFRGTPDSAAKVFDMANRGKIDLILSANLKEVNGNGKLEKVILEDKSKQDMTIDADYLIPLFGLSPKLGPIADWGL